MAVIKRPSSKVGVTKPLSPSSSSTIGIKFNLEIPDGPSEPVYELNRATIFLHGEQKIGKTTLASCFDDPLFLMFEPGAKFLRVARIPEQGQFNSWAQFVRIVDLLEKDKRYQTIVIDTVDLSWDLATRHICEIAQEDSINEGSLGFNKGNNKLEHEFKKQILRITSTGRGVIFISHTKSQDFEKAGGVKYSKVIPTTQDKARQFLKGFADGTFYYGYFGEDRYLVIEGNENLDAGNRIDGRFLTPKGQKVIAVPMGDTAEEGYNNFLAAFNNKQVDPERLSRKASLSEVKAKFTVKKK